MSDIVARERARTTALLENIDRKEATRKVDGYVDPCLRRGYAFLFTRLGLRGQFDDDLITAAIAAMGADDRLRLLQTLPEWFDIESSLMQSLIDALHQPGKLSWQIWMNFFQHVTDTEEEDEWDGLLSRPRPGKSPERFRLHFQRTVQMIFDNMPSSEANLESFATSAAELGELFGIGETEQKLLILLYLFSRLPESDEAFPTNDTATYVSYLCEALDISESELRQITRIDGPLVQTQLLRLQVRGLPFETTEMVDAFLSGLRTKESLQDYVTLDSGEVYPLCSFPVSSLQRQIILKLLKDKTARSLLFYGAPGAGKTELARTVTRAAGRKALWVSFPDSTWDDSDKNSEKRPNRLGVLTIAATMARAEQAVLVIDEADELLNTEGVLSTGGKGALNFILDRLDVSTIWITNESGEIHSSAVRRIDHSLRFEQPRDELRYRRLTAVLKEKDRQLPAKARRGLAERFDVSLGSLSKAVETACVVHQKQSAGGSGPEFLETLEELLDREHELAHGKSAPPAELRDGVTSTTGVPYRPEAVHANRAVADIATTAERFFGQRRIDGAAVGPLNMLFHGAPGTGKTAFATHLANTLNRRLITVTGSDLLGPFVGETEQKIAGMFREAESEGAILLLDEAENLLQRRRAAQNGWERQHTNEFLARMERHSSVFIATTNELSVLDPAVYRRFALKVAFYPLRREDRLTLYRAYFTLSHRKLTRELQEEILKLDGLTAGHIRTVYNRIRFRIDASTSHREIINELQEELHGVSAAGEETVVVGFSEPREAPSKGVAARRRG